MNKIDKEYKKLLRTILQEGYWYNDPNRNGVKRLQLNDYKLVHNFEDGFPILTSKQTYYKGAFGELLCFLRGNNNLKYLYKNGVRFWDKDGYNYYKKLALKNNVEPVSLEEFLKFSSKGDTKDYFPNYTFGDLGKIYPHQLRNWNGHIDQIKDLVKTLKENPLSTKKTVTMWNPSDLDSCALSPCHWSFEALVTKLEAGYGLTIKWHQHSVDSFLGLPLNIIYYSSLCYMLAELVEMKPLGIIGDLSNVHLYDNAIDGAKKQLKQKSFTAPNFNFSPKANILFNKFKGEKGFIDYGYYNELDNVLNSLSVEDFEINNYESSRPIKVEMLEYR